MDRFKAHEELAKADNHAEIVRAEAFGDMLRELDSTDLLLRLNAIESCRQVAGSEAGYRALCSAGAIEKVVRLLEPDGGSSDGHLVQAAVIGLVAQLAEKEAAFNALSHAAENYNVFGHLTALLAGAVDATPADTGLLSAIAVLLGAIASAQGARALLTRPPHDAFLHAFAANVWPVATGDLRTRSVEALSCSLQPHEGGAAGSDEAQRVWNAISAHAQPATAAGLLAEIVQYARSAIPETSIAAYGALTGLAQTPWGLQLLLPTADTALPWLLDRATIRSKLEAEWRFALIQALHRSAESSTADLDARPLEDYLQQGVFSGGPLPGSSVATATSGR